MLAAIGNPPASTGKKPQPGREVAPERDLFGHGRAAIFNDGLPPFAGIYIGEIEAFHNYSLPTLAVWRKNVVGVQGTAHLAAGSHLRDTKSSHDGWIS
jgi:hypothetical protein